MIEWKDKVMKCDKAHFDISSMIGHCEKGPINPPLYMSIEEFYEYCKNYDGQRKN